MKNISLFHSVNREISAMRNRTHLMNPVIPFKMIVDEQANLMVFATKREYLEYLDSRDVELCRY